MHNSVVLNRSRMMIIHSCDDTDAIEPLKFICIEPSTNAHTPSRPKHHQGLLSYDVHPSVVTDVSMSPHDGYPPVRWGIRPIMMRPSHRRGVRLPDALSVVTKVNMATLCPLVMEYSSNIGCATEPETFIYLMHFSVMTNVSMATPYPFLGWNIRPTRMCYQARDVHPPDLHFGYY